MTNLELLRRTAGFSQETLANRLLYSTSIISRLETGALPLEQVHPRLRKTLEEHFNHPLEYLLSKVRVVIENRDN